MTTLHDSLVVQDCSPSLQGSSAPLDCTLQTALLAQSETEAVPWWDTTTHNEEEHKKTHLHNVSLYYYN